MNRFKNNQLGSCESLLFSLEDEDSSFSSDSEFSEFESCKSWKKKSKSSGRRGRKTNRTNKTGLLIQGSKDFESKYRSYNIFSDASNFIEKKNSQSNQEHFLFNKIGWEVRNIVSRSKHNRSRLTSNVFFTSFDQRDNKARGEGACSVVAIVTAHWLHSNPSSLPTVPIFESLIVEGSSIWRNLCEINAYKNLFPDLHFDLETVLEAKLNPVTISSQNSYTGFFSPEKFEHLKELMSFDDIWYEITHNYTTTADKEQKVYIMSWCNHFFVLKLEPDAYYIIDSFGERLLEGCKQAYIIKFDESSLIYDISENDEKEVIVCQGKECCKEYIKRFLADITLRELQETHKGDAIPIIHLMKSLQIDFHNTLLFS